MTAHSEIERLLAAYAGAIDPDALYAGCFVRGLSDAVPPSEPDEDLTAHWSTTFHAHDLWDHGWQLIKDVLADGSVVATTGLVTRSFAPGQYVAYGGPGALPQAKGLISVFLPAFSTEVQPGYFHVFGETVGELEEDEDLVRFYWHIRLSEVSRLVETLRMRLNLFAIPFRFKFGIRASAFARRDAAVLYVHKRYYHVTAMLAEEIHGQVAECLNPETPIFTRHLAPGLAFAEDPGNGESFGMSRCEILTCALQAIRDKKIEGPGARLGELREQFEKRGLSLDAPWLNAGTSESRYPYPVE